MTYSNATRDDKPEETLVSTRWLGFTLLAGGVVCTFICWLALQFDFFRGDATVFYGLFSIIWAGNVALFFIGNKSLLRRLGEPLVVNLVLGWSTLVVLCLAVYIDQMRLGVMLLFFAILQSSVFHASNRMQVGLGITATLGYGGILVWSQGGLASLSWGPEWMKWTAFAAVAIGAVLLAIDISTMRLEVAERNRRLSTRVAETEGLALRDELTGLYNRRHARTVFDKLGKMNQRGEVSLHLAYIDLDHFKRINDHYGHRAGDEVLMTFADLLRQYFSGVDVTARVGGEEFLVVMLNASDAQAQVRLETLRVVWESVTIVWESATIKGQPDISMTLSAGLCRVARGESVAKAMSRADDCLYRAKQNGRNGICASQELVESRQ